MLARSMWLIGAMAFVAVGCAPMAQQTGKVPAAVTAAVADAGRPDADKQRDADRRPAETVAFTGIKKGDHVAEFFPGGGYFTRILSKVVGEKGVIYAIAPPPRPDAPPNAPPPAVNAIAADPAYANVKVSQQRFSEFSVPAPVDAVWTSLNYHDFHNAPNADMKALNTRVFNALKPGGVYIIIDHAAAAGSGVRDTSTLHRIDPAAVKSEVTAAGFVLEGESDVLKHPADDHTAQIRDAGVRGKTDQFLLKFRKPKK